MAKRRELQELEAAFRKRMDSRVTVESKYKDKSQRTQSIMDDLQAQIADSKAILSTAAQDSHSLTAQVEAKEASIAQREAEINSVREQIAQRAARGDELKRVLDGLISENGRLREQKMTDMDDLARAKELRKVRKQEGEEMIERAKRLRGQLHGQQDKLRATKETVLQKDSELECIEQELQRA